MMVTPQDPPRLRSERLVATTVATSSTPRSLVEPVYAQWSERVAVGRQRLSRPLTFAEKVLVNHLRESRSQELDRGRSYADFDPDRVALQDALAQIVVLQLLVAGI